MIEEKKIPWLELLESVWRQKRLALYIVLAGAALTAALVLMRSPVYRAKATILLAAQRISGPRVEGMSDKQIESELALLSSPALIRSVLADHQPPAPKAAPMKSGLGGLFGRRLPPPDPLDEKVRAVGKDIETTRVSDTNLVEVAYRSTNPGWAATLVNELLDRHVERIAKLGEQTDARGFFQKQDEVMSRRLSAAKDALARYRQKQGTELAETDEVELRKSLAQVALDRATAQTQLAEAQAKAGYLSGELGRHPQTVSSESEVRQNEGVKLLQDKVLQLEVQRADLLAKYAPTSTVIEDLDHRIEAEKKLLAGKQLESKTSSRTAVNPTYQTMEVDLVQKRAESAALAARIAGLSRQEAATRAQLERITTSTPELARLQNEVKSANDTYLDYMKKAEEARLSRDLDKSGIVNINVLERAQVPDHPEPSRASFFMLAGLLVSLGVGLVAAVLRDRLDPAVRSGLQAERLAGVQVIGEVPG